MPTRRTATLLTIMRPERGHGTEAQSLSRDSAGLRRYKSQSPRMLSVLRIMAALLFIQHGTQKFFGFPPPASPGPGLTTLLVVQGFLELVGGFLLLIGFFTRPVAFILAGDMAVAYFMRHAPRSFFPVLN